MGITNIQFLKAIFGGQYDHVHVTDFTYDPLNIPSNEHLRAWKGDYFKNHKFKPQSNQYFTISLFQSDDSGIARRRKSLFKSTHVIVLDDVGEKLPRETVTRLPKPSYILESSPGSEQWGYILTQPCTDRSMVENLLDGLVENGLAPKGKDPGMKGVTRYVRLPEGYNTKKSKMIEGEPYKCRMLAWNPFNRTSIEKLAEPFQVDLYAQRREHRVDGASNIPDHPLLKTNLKIKETRSDGRFDITCPWVNEHTGAVDNGAVIFTNEDGSIGFKCHHGACEHRTGSDLLNHLGDDFKEKLALWKFKKSFESEQIENWKGGAQNSTCSISTKDTEKQPIDQELALIHQMEVGKTKRDTVSKFLKSIDDLPEIEKQYYHQEICDIMHWTKSEFAKIIKDLRTRWYEKKQISFYNSIVFIKELNQFYDYNTKIFYKPDAFQNSFANEDGDAKKEALVNGRVDKVDKMDFYPKEARIFIKDGVKYANFWSAKREILGKEGDCSWWLKHWDYLGWGVNKDHMLKWMAYTIRYPENKINHMLLLGGAEGTGKDYILYPLIKAMGDYARVINGNDFLSSFNDYILNTKYLHINETELGDHKQAVEISNKIKPLAAAPPDTLRVNRKNLNIIDVQNIVNLTMTTNSQMPVKLSGPSRRFYAVWSDVQVRDRADNILPDWLKYWESRWDWMKNDGVLNCIWYLRNCVDLSNFSPGESPPMTEFLRNIQEASKSPGQQTIEAMIRNEAGVFKNDLLTASDILSGIKAMALLHDEHMYIDASWFTPVKIGRILRDIPSCVQLRARGEKDLKVWAIRNRHEYESMSGIELYNKYKERW